MRDALLGALVILICLVSLYRPKYGLYGYLWYALMMPDVFTWSTHRPYSLALGFFLVVGSIRELTNAGRIFKNPFAILFLLLQVPIALSVVFAVHPGLNIQLYRQFVQMSLIVVLIPLLIESVNDMKWLLLVLGGSLGLLGSKYGLWAVVRGGARIINGPGDFMSENNTFGLALCMALPLIWVIRRQLNPVWFRILFMVMSLLTLFAIVMTHSRGAILTLAVVLLVIAVRARHKIAAGIMLTALTIVAGYLVRDTLVPRIETLENVQGEASARSRIELQKAAFWMWRDHPIIGVGFGGRSFARLSPQYNPKVPDNVHVVHNNYLEMAVDSGTIAFLLFISLLFGSIWWLGRSGKRMWRLGNGFEVYPYAIQGCLIAFAVGSTFTSRTYYDFIYMVLMSAAAWYNVAETIPESGVVPVVQPQPAPSQSRGTPVPVRAAPSVSRPRRSLSIQRQLSEERRRSGRR